jgi:hypothetical protein
MMRRILLGLQALLSDLDNRIIWHGLYADDPRFWHAEFEKARAEYAKANPWVLAYGFGHKELIEKLKPKVI